MPVPEGLGRGWAAVVGWRLQEEGRGVRNKEGWRKKKVGRPGRVEKSRPLNLNSIVMKGNK